MIYITAICSDVLINYDSYELFINDILNKINKDDKIIIVTSSLKNHSSELLEQILKLNINTPDNLIDLLLSNIEIESTGFLGIILDKYKTNYDILTPYQIPILVNNEEIEYVEINNILSVLSKKQILIIPGNIGISRTLKPQYYGSDGPEYLGFYLYKEFKKRRLKALCYIYKDNKENNDSMFSDKVECLIKSHNLSYTIKNL